MARAGTNDPLVRRVLRLARVALATGVAREIPLSPSRAAAAIGVLHDHGLNVRMLHALHAATHPWRPALVDSRRTLTYGEADREIDRVANALRTRFGVRPRDAVAIALENRVEYVVAWFALARIGARAVHAGSHATREELAHVLATSEARVIVASAAALDAVRALGRDEPSRGLAVIVCSPAAPAFGEIAYEAIAREGDATFPAEIADGGGSESVVYTAGTTGAPKGAVRDFAAFGPRELARVVERLPLAFGDRHLVVGPLSHSAPQVMMLLHTALAGTVHLLPRFDAEEALRALSRREIQSVFMVPTMLRRVLDLPPAVHAACPTPHLRALIVGSSEFTGDLRRAAIARFGARAVFDFYGATELGWVTLVRGDEMLRKPGSVGRPLAGQEIRIVRPDGSPCAPSEPGRIEVRNQQTMLGYLQARRATREPTSSRSTLAWSTVEDLGWLDDDGYLFLSGRARDMVKSGGVNVYPAEVERVLADDPAIGDVAVIGVPDRDWGERVVAVVVPKAGGFDPARSEARARERLSPAKVPKRWEIVEALPRNANGKVLKGELRARFGASA